MCAAWGASCLAFGMAAASANSRWFTRSWQTDEGLPNSYITAIAQGADGYLWLGTPDGLLRFDGVRFTKQSYGESNSTDPTIRAVSIRRSGGLWIQPNRGPLIGLNAELSRLRLPENGLPADNPLGVTETADGSLWIGYPNVVCRIEAGQVTRFTTNEGAPPGGNMTGMITDSADHVWMAKGGKFGIFSDGKFQRISIQAPSRMTHLAPSRTNGVWVGTGTHLYKCDATGTVQDLGSFETDNPRAETWVLLEDRNGAVWIGTDGSGLYRRDKSGFEKIEISHPYILSLAEDNEGNVWAGTAGGGLNRISPRAVQLEGLPSGDSLVAIQSICQDAHNVLWGATQNGLLVCRQNGEWQQPIPNEAALRAVTCVAADQHGAIWIGTRDRKLRRLLDGKLTSWGIGEGFAGHTVVGLWPASTGDLWISEIGPVAIQRLDREARLHTMELPGEDGRITALVEDAAGQIWAASSSGLLMRNEQDRMVDVSSSIASPREVVLCLYPTSDGALWIGYEGAGLGHFKNGRFARADSRQGLFDDHISEMVADDQGWFWFGSGRGIFKILRADLEGVIGGRAGDLVSIRYGRNEGLFSVEANSANVNPFVSPTALRSSDGHLWMPLRKAIAVVNPAALQNTTTPPPVYLTEVLVDGHAVAQYGENEADHRVANLKSMSAPWSVPPGHRRLEFGFAAVNLTAPANVHFRYQLQGFDNDWMNAGTERSALYSRLVAGKYRFRVEASYGNGPWQESATAFAFIVTPFFWQTWAFRAGALALFTAIVIALVRYISFRRMRTALRTFEQQAALEREKARIARDLHDNLGSRLTRIMTLSKLTFRDREAPEKTSAHARQIGTTAKQVINLVDETVWVLNPRNDNLPNFLNYVGQTAVDFLHEADIRCRVDLPEHPRERILSADVRHNLFLVVQEALNNVARHARATEVWLRATDADGRLTLAIADNGCGFDHPPLNGSAEGLRNMRQRMTELDGELHIKSGSGAGTRITLVYRWPNAHDP